MQTNDSSQHLQKAAGLIQSKRLDEALNLLGNIIRTWPNDAQGHLLHGIALYYRGNAQASQAAFERTLAIDPNNSDAWHNLGNALVRQRRDAEAARAFGRSMEISPRRDDTAFNLGLCLRRLRRLDDAREVLDSLLARKPDYAEAWSALGLVQQDQEDFEAALASYDKCLQLNPGSLSALQNKAVILRRKKRYREAVDYSTRALAINPDVPAAHQNLGSALAALGEADQAIEAYRRAVELEPGNATHHHWLNLLLWSEGRQDFLSSYHEVLGRHPDAHELRSELVYKLSLADRLEPALEQAEILVQRNAADPYSHKLYGSVLRRLRRFDEALAAHRKAHELNPQIAVNQEELATSLLAIGDAESALRVVDRLIAAHPLHQGYLALKTTALRMLGDERYRALCDYDRLVLRTIIEKPRGYASLEAFNQALKEQLLQLHISKEHPLDQSLVNGTQTIDDLFADPEGPVAQLQACFDEQMHAFLARLPHDPAHPTLARNHRSFQCTGAWSVLLRSTGFHRNHYHSAGWYSGPYYVDLPAAVQDEQNKQGWIKFGEPSFECAEPLGPDLLVKPEPGLMVRFPSYVWHGTVPFTTDETRLVVSVDLDPGRQPTASAGREESAAFGPGPAGSPSDPGIASF
jgi:tetratricopeptide (TPR) repeat protein